jgi:RHS repeat-associated protein
MTTTSGSVYYHHDGLGNTIAITNGNADVLERYSYDVFGLVNVVDASTGNSIPQSGHGVRHFYTGHDFQAELGLYLTHYRAYEPVLGRWLSADPIGEAGGINLYGYVANNPVNMIDPDGRNPIVRKIIQKILEKILKPKPKPKPKDKDKNKPPVPPGTPDIPDYNEDPTECPGEGYEWREKGEPGSDKGSWYNPETDTSVHPNRNHPEPIGPHNDVHTPDGDYRQYPDGRIEPK